MTRVLVLGVARLCDPANGYQLRRRRPRNSRAPADIRVNRSVDAGLFAALQAADVSTVLRKLL